VSQLNKVEQKLSVAQQKEHELRLAVAAGGEVEAGHEKEHQVREAQAAAAAAEVAAVKGTVESSRHKVGSGKVALERLQAGGRGPWLRRCRRGSPWCASRRPTARPAPARGTGFSRTSMRRGLRSHRHPLPLDVLYCTL